MPEKSLDEINRSLRELYEKGLTALQRQNWDYAIALFNQVLQSEPAFYDCREALRAAQFKKAGAGPGLFKKWFGTASNSPQIAKGQVMLRNNPLEVLKIAENILNGDPNSASAHKLLAEAALAADLPRTAVLSLEIGLKNAPKNRDIAFRLGEALLRTGQIERAENIYTDLQRSHPNDPEIAQALKDASAHRTMAEGGYDALSDGGGSYRDILKDKAGASLLEQDQREVKSPESLDRLIEDHELRLKKEPANLKLVRSLAELYAQKKEFDRAIDCCRRIVTQEGPADPSVEKAISDLVTRKMDHQIAQLDPEAADYTGQLERLEREKQEFQLTEGKRRAERYPNDLQIRFELGRLYFETGHISEAIQEFQKAQANPHRRLACLRYLGQCFAQRGMNDLAARTLQNAIKEKLVFDDEKKELVYLLGSVLDKMGKADEAVEQFKQVYEIDIGYKDVASRVDAYYASKG